MVTISPSLAASALATAAAIRARSSSLIVAITILPMLRRRLPKVRLGGLGRCLQLGDDGVGAGDDSARIVVGLEARQDDVADDLTRQGVGQDPLHAVADLDPDLVLGWGDEQDDAIVGAL